MEEGKLTFVSDKVGKDIPKKKPITIPMNVAIMSFIPSFIFLPFELQNRASNQLKDMDQAMSSGHVVNLTSDWSCLFG